jgi:hypothetical protein
VARNRDAEEGAQLFEQTLDMRRVLWLLRRQWWVVAACVVVGALIPTIAMLWLPTSYTATSLVLVPTSANGGSSGGSNGGPGNNNTTDSAIAESAAVLTAAASRVTPHMTLQAAQSRVKAAAVATNLVQITATGSSPRAAEALANAVANRLVAFVTSPDVSNGSSALAGLEAQAAALTTQVNKYDQEIQLEKAAIQSSPSPSVAQSDTQLLGSLTTAQSNASLELQSVNSQIAAAKLNNAAVNGGTEVIQHASSATSPSVSSRFLPTAVGAILGFLIGGAYVVVRHRKSNLSTRDEIASAAGIPVVISSVVGHLSRSSDWLTLLREQEPSVTEMWNVRKVLSSLDVLEAGRRRVVTVITLADDSASMAAVAQFAVAAAVMDIPTSLVLMSDDSGLRGLSDACDLLTARSETARPNLRVVKGSPPVDEAVNALNVISIVLNPDQPKLPAFVARGSIFLALSAGFAGEEQLARVLIAIGQEGLSVEGLFIANPMSADRTLGSLSTPSEQVTRSLQPRALEPWVGGADVR